MVISQKLQLLLTWTYLLMGQGKQSLCGFRRITQKKAGKSGKVEKKKWKKK